MKHRIPAYALLLVPLMFASCAMMTVDRTNCPSCYNPLHVILDYAPQNLSGYGGAPEGVSSATCYLLNTDGDVLQRMTANNDPALNHEGYAFNFEDLQSGLYRTLTISAQQPFGGSTPNRPYITELQEGDNIAQLQFVVPRADTPDADGYYPVDNSRPLDSIYVMKALRDEHNQPLSVMELPDYDPLTVYAQPMRLTNNLNVVLAQLQNPASHDAANYIVRVIDHNGRLDYQGNPLDSTPLVYAPFAQWNTETVEEDPATPSPAPATRAPGDIIDRSAHYDLSLCRLLYHTNAQDNARLQVINRQDGTVVMDIDLIEYLLRLRNSYETNVSYQNFLDQQDDFRISIVLAGNEWRYMDISINVLAWSVRIQNVTL